MKTWKIILIGIITHYCFTANAQFFTNVNDSAGIDHVYFGPIGGGVAAFDYNNDGWEDLYITGGLGLDKLYKNNGDGTFEERSIFAAGFSATLDVYTQGVTTADINNDGRRDILITTWGHFGNTRLFAPNLLYRNNGNGTFTNITNSSGLVSDSSWSTSASFGDYNLDGYLDIYIGNYLDSAVTTRDTAGEVNGYAHTCLPNYFYINNGNMTFTEIGSTLGVTDAGCALAVAFTDIDNDYDLDLYVANDYGEWVLPSAMLRNDYPSNSFTDISVASGTDNEIYGMGIGIGDYDLDGYFDYYVTNIGPNILYENQGNETFDDVADSAGVINEWEVFDTLRTTGWGANFFDYDNNLYPDLFVSNGWVGTPAFIAAAGFDPNKFYVNQGDGTFSDQSLLAGLADTSISRGSVILDYDNDGDQDLFVMNIDYFGVIGDTLDPKATLFRNDQVDANNWLKVKLEGVANNRDGIGSRVRVIVAGNTLIREVDGGSSHMSQSSSVIHFGLGNNTSADTLEVIWPGGARQVYSCVEANQLFEILEDTSGTSLLLCPGNVTTGTDSNLCGASVFYQVPVKNPGTAGDSLFFASGLGSGGFFPVGTHIESYLLKDTSGRTLACCNIEIRVEDQEPAIITCPSGQALYADSGMNGSVVTYDPPLANDNCLIDTVILIDGLSSGSFFPIGLNTISYGAISGTGDSASCSFDVIVNEDTLLNHTIDLYTEPMISIFPVPADDKVHIVLDLTAEQYIDLRIYNLQGKEMKLLRSGVEGAGKQLFTWDSEDPLYSGGLYFVRLLLDDHIYEQKLLIY